ncbi:MAG: PulJ/GspJ family protein [Chthonomonadales bacterium]
MKNRRAGFTLIEMLVAGLISVIIGAGLWTLVRSAYDAEYMLINQNTANANARQVVDLFADHLRGTSGLVSASPSDVTFSDNAGNSIRYWVATDGTLRTSVNNVPAGGNQILAGVQSLSLTYYTWNGSAWVSSTSPAVPGSVGAADIVVVVNINGFTRRLSSRVRFREK